LRRELLHWIEEGHRTAGGERHPEEYSGVYAENYLRQTDGGLTAVDPWPADDRLRSVFGKFTALRGFVLHAPLADPLAEGETGKLAATSNAVCHKQ